ncbi:hypothetical protein B4113_0708 [Geobacillus sp. B4113_201601]|nr:hypothetical protein B4113_0708 [Geobacillus sp. B4113_201601]
MESARLLCGAVLIRAPNRCGRFFFLAGKKNEKVCCKTPLNKVYYVS